MRNAAELGHADAQYQVGSAYQTGSGVLVDKNAAVGWYSEAAEQGHADARYCLCPARIRAPT
jgi:TPR repeat protein